MRLRTRVDVFGTALLSALGATQLAACGNGASASSSANAGAAGVNTNTAGAHDGAGGRGGASSGGTDHGGQNDGGASSAGSNSCASGSNSGGSDPGSAGSLGSAGAGATLNRFPCQNPKDLGAGFVQCDGFVHHQTIHTCASHVPRPGMVSDLVCKVDSQCTEKPYGYCGVDPSSGEGSFCRYGCVTSADCATGEQCECAEPVGLCVRADCASDADCESGFLCRSYETGVGCGLTKYWCQSSADACGTDADCTSGRCGYDGTSHSFQCLDRFCAVGRPFLVEGAERLAPSATRTDWSELAGLPRLLELDAASRRRVAERWTRIALMEHASIAAFARFALQLLSLGAPASLIERANAALADETKHAKACFALASHYAGTPLGPGSLAVERSLDESSLTAITLNALREGCVGETVAAIEAREAAEYAADPALRALLLEISADETRHAELAFRFVRWASSLGGPELARALQREFAELAAEELPSAAALTAEDEQLLRHGVVPDALRRTIRSQAIAQVILPCSRLLFEAAAPPGGSEPDEISNSRRPFRIDEPGPFRRVTERVCAVPGERQ